MNSKDKVLYKHEFEKDESKGIKEYRKAIKHTKGKEKKTYREILPNEEKHLKMIKKI